MDIRFYFEKYGFQATDAQADDFVRWVFEQCWSGYNSHVMEKRRLIQTELDMLPIVIPNGTVLKAYRSPAITLLPADKAGEWEWIGLEELGLQAEAQDDGTYVVTGRPTQMGDYTITLRCKYAGWVEGEPLIERKLPFAVNPNPRDLWTSQPVPDDTPYNKPDAECYAMQVGDGVEQKRVIAASVRGRSHAHVGKPRDDHYLASYCADTGWYVLAVADGAGSAEYSRQGSKIACEVAVAECNARLRKCRADSQFEADIAAYQVADGSDGSDTARKRVGNDIYGIIGQAAFAAHRAIGEFAMREHREPKTFATTLLLCIAKRFAFGWFVASFWVGDGAICLYDAATGQARMLGVPDEGEFSGQTRFLTMPEVMRDPTKVYQRLRFCVVPDFTALMLMTDGVSDPMFGTDANLKDPAKWDRLWHRLQGGFPDDGIEGVDLDGSDAAKQLMAWLDFWQTGEHDDRTLAMLC